MNTKDLVIKTPGVISITDQAIESKNQYSLKFSSGLGLLVGRTTRSENLNVEDGKAELTIYPSDIEKLSQYENLNYNLYCLTTDEDIVSGKIILQLPVVSPVAEESESVERSEL